MAVSLRMRIKGRTRQARPPVEVPASLRLYTKQEVAEILSISIRSLERLINNGEIEMIKMGPRAVRIRASAVEDYLDRCSEV